jgi:hypothetical protein
MGETVQVGRQHAYCDEHNDSSGPALAQIKVPYKQGYFSSADVFSSRRRETMNCWIRWLPSKMSWIFPVQTRAHRRDPRRLVVLIRRSHTAKYVTRYRGPVELR